MLADSLTRASETADRFVADARIKAANAAAPASMVAGGPTDGGQSISVYGAADQYASNRGWAGAAVRLVANRIAAQGICVARESKRSTRGMLGTKTYCQLKQSLPIQFKANADRLEPLPQHPLLDVLHDPNEMATAWSLIFCTIASMELTGRALWYAKDGGQGKRELYHLPTHWIREIDTKRRVWKIQPGRSAQSWDLPWEQVVNFYYPDPSDPMGALSPLQQIAAAVTADESISEAQWRTFKQGLWPGLVLTAGRLPGAMPGTDGQRPVLTAEQRNQLVTAIKGGYQSVHRMGEPIIVDGLIEKIEKLTLTPSELDFLNSSKLTKSKILQFYGVSPILLGEVEGANRASATVADEIFCANKVNPLIAMLSQAMTEWLGPIFAGPGEKLTIWIDEAVPHDPELTLKKFEIGRRNGDVSGNEYRTAVLNMESKVGLDEFGPPTRQQPAPPAAETAGDPSNKSAAINPYTLKRFLNGSAH